MMEVLRVPLLNANEDELSVAGVHVRVGDQVRAGELLFSLESTKATSDVEAPRAGWVRRIDVAEGERVPVGAILAVLTDGPDDPLAELEAAGARDDAGPRATRRARELAERHGIDLAAVPARGIVKERDVLALVDERASASTAQPTTAPPALGTLAWGPNPVVVFGAGGHARVLIDVIREGHRDLTVVAAVDDGVAAGETVSGVPVVGGSERLGELRERGVELAVLGVGAVTHNQTRIALHQRLLDAGFRVPNLIHPRAAIEPSVTMGEGNQVFAGAIVGSGATLGDDVIVNSGVVVSHDCRIDSHVHLTPGAILAGGVGVGEGSVIGMGVTVYLGVTIGRGVVISNGVHVLTDVADGAVVRA